MKENCKMVPPSAAAPTVLDILRRGPLQVCVIGGGNWGTIAAALICENARTSYLLKDEVIMWVHERHQEPGVPSVADTINQTRENARYAPGLRLPDNLRAESDLLRAAETADLLCFVVPHQYILDIAEKIKDVVKPTARAISLLKGLHVEDGVPMTYTQRLKAVLGDQMSICALSGANVANDIGRGQFSETTIGYDDPDMAVLWQQVFQRPHFRVSLLPDVDGLQVCGALKNLIALSAGFADGLECGSNTKAAIIRIGVEEMRKFASYFFESLLEETFLDSCGYADVITTCYGGRNVRCATEFIRRGQNDSWEKIEADLLNGQKMQGQLSCYEVYHVISKHKIEDQFPLFTVTYQIAFEGENPQSLIDKLQGLPPAKVKKREQCTPLQSVRVMSGQKSL